MGYNSCTLPIPFNTLEPYPQGYANPWHSLDLIDGTRATGEFVFRGGQSPSPSHADDTTPAPFSYDGKIDPVLLQESNGGGVSDNEGTRAAKSTAPEPSQKRSSHYDLLPDPASEDDDKFDVQTERPAAGRKRRRSAAATSPESEPTKARRVSAGEGMTSIASSLENVAGTMATAMENIATKMQPTSSPDSTNTLTALAEMARLMRPRSPAAPATAHTTDPRTAAIQSIEDDEGFSDDDLASAATCIMTNEGLAKMYLLLKSRGARASLIRSHMHRAGLQ